MQVRSLSLLSFTHSRQQALILLYAQPFEKTLKWLAPSIGKENHDWQLTSILNKSLPVPRCHQLAVPCVDLLPHFLRLLGESDFACQLQQLLLLPDTSAPLDFSSSSSSSSSSAYWTSSSISSSPTPCALWQMSFRSNFSAVPFRKNTFQLPQRCDTKSLHRLHQPTLLVIARNQTSEGSNLHLLGL